MIPGFSSTGSKRPDLLFGSHPGPQRMARADGCRVWDEDGREYIDFIMALGAVSLGYAHPRVVAAATRALEAGGVGSLAPVHETRLAGKLAEMIPGFESVRFLKTGAEAVSAAVRMARVITDREHVVASGYHGWLDPVSQEAGVPAAAAQLRTEVPFNDVSALQEAFDREPPAALVIEPVVDGNPSGEWVHAVQKLTRASSTILVLDEIKTGLRLGLGGGAKRFGYEPDLVVLGKALGNGLPIAAVGGRTDVMDAATRTWISSTLATEFVALAAADAVLDEFAEQEVPERLATLGGQLFLGLQDIAQSAPHAVQVRGIPEMCYLEFVDGARGEEFASRCAAQGLLFKRNAYNFVSLGHDPEIIRESLACVQAQVEQVGWT